MTTTVLIADDDALLRRAMADRLRSAGYEVLEAADGRSAIQRAEEHRPDALVLDVHMPFTDGLSVLDQLDLSASLSGLPVIYISGDHDPALYEAAMKRGAGCVVHKPFSGEQLIEALRLLAGEFPTVL